VFCDVDFGKFGVPPALKMLTTIVYIDGKRMVTLYITQISLSDDGNLQNLVEAMFRRAKAFNNNSIVYYESFFY